MTRSAFDNGITKSLVEAARIMLSEGASQLYEDKGVEDDDIPTIFHDNGDKEWRKRGKPHRDGDKPAIVRDNGDKEWHQHGKLHRDGDKPAVVHVDGRKEWHQHGVRHRDGDKHAVEYPSGSKEWYQHGRLHREGDKPAAVSANGDKEWYKHDQRHRDGDKPATEHPDGQKSWFKNGEIHRDGDKPAVVHTSSQSWYKHGRLHRDGDKPAIVRTNGDKEWYKHGVQHRDGDKPAIDDVKGHKEWHKHGKRHRENGPAVIWSSGDKEWYENGYSTRPREKKQTKLGEGYQIDELSKETLRSYAQKAHNKRRDSVYKSNDNKRYLSQFPSPEAGRNGRGLTSREHGELSITKNAIKKHDNIDRKRTKGIEVANRKLAREEFTVEDFENMTNEEREEFLNQKLNEIEKDSYVTHKKSGAVGRVTSLSGDRSSVDIEWNDKKSKHHPSQPMNRVKKFK